MIIKDLIKLLEEEYQKQLPLKEFMGEPSIMIDLFKWNNNKVEYLGITKDFIIDTTNDGVYSVLAGKPKE